MVASSSRRSRGISPVPRWAPSQNQPWRLRPQLQSRTRPAGSSTGWGPAPEDGRSTTATSRSRLLLSSVWGADGVAATPEVSAAGGWWTLQRPDRAEGWGLAAPDPHPTETSISPTHQRSRNRVWGRRSIGASARWDSTPTGSMESPSCRCAGHGRGTMVSPIHVQRRRSVRSRQRAERWLQHKSKCDEVAGP